MVLVSRALSEHMQPYFLPDTSLFSISKTISLAKVHNVLQIAFGWAEF
jgi:hypothetical protein